MDEIQGTLNISENRIIVLSSAPSYCESCPYGPGMDASGFCESNRFSPNCCAVRRVVFSFSATTFYQFLLGLTILAGAICLRILFYFAKCSDSTIFRFRISVDSVLYSSENLFLMNTFFYRLALLNGNFKYHFC